MSELLDRSKFGEVKSYSEIFGLSNLLNTKYKSYIDSKISRFVVLINDFIEKLTVKELNSNINLSKHKRNIIKIVSILSDYIRIGDNLIDSYYDDRSYENYKKYIRGLATLAISSFTVQSYFKKLPIDGNKLVLKALFNLKEVAEIEVELKKNPANISEDQIIMFTEKRNSDFFLYYSFLTPFIKPEINEIILEFFKHYVILDNILDDMTDIYSDYEGNNFNMLLIMLKNLNSIFDHKQYSDLIRDIVENNIYNDIFGLFKKHYDLANTVIMGLNSRFFEYLKFLLNGSFEGFNLFRKNQFFIDLLYDEPKKHKDISDLLFKPYPWTIISYDEIFI